MKEEIKSMVACTQRYSNSHWVLITNEGRVAGVLKAQPFENIEERLQNALVGHFDGEDLEIVKLTEFADQIHEVKVLMVTDGYHELITLTPSWEY